jgi:phosphoribosyl 1,2-cyclic phosphodiesterase
MRVKLWGVRGSVPVPGHEWEGFGGNTSCVQVTTDDGSVFILDAGTGIRDLGRALEGGCRRIHLLLTHLHLDHIQGLMFFAPLFDPEVEVTVWGPPSAGRSLRKRLARYISNPLSPIEIGELPAKVSFEDVPGARWSLDGIEVGAALISHRGVTLGYRLSENGASLAYLPDHEPGLGQSLATSNPRWISGRSVAKNASLLLHDCQYTDAEYLARRGWGHSRLSDTLTFGQRSEAERLLLFHHDPNHDDPQLEALEGEAAERWPGLPGQGTVAMAREGEAFDL